METETCIEKYVYNGNMTTAKTPSSKYMHYNNNKNSRLVAQQKPDRAHFTNINTPTNHIKHFDI